jgi:8-oxo-dGTP diphosphatase
LSFYPAPFRAPLRAFAGLVFPWSGEKVLICDIFDRGWCIPSGRVEPGETSVQAVLREALEEGGAVLDHLQYIGCYRIDERREVRWADCYTARIKQLVDIVNPVESKGRRLVSIEELPEIYHVWNPLTEQVFQHSLLVLSRLKLPKDEEPGEDSPGSSMPPSL